jgi:hypothetical protein
MLISMEGAPEVLRTSRRRKILKPLVVLLAVILILSLVIHNLKSPAIGTINQTPPDKAEAQDPFAKPMQLTGKYISYSAPAHYRKIASTTTGSYLQVDNFYATDQSEKQISVGVMKEDLNTDTGFNLRKQHPDTYTQEPMSRSGAYIFDSSANGTEKNAFVSHGGYVASISLTAPAGWDLDQDLQTILSSLKWNL